MNFFRPKSPQLFTTLLAFIVFAFYLHKDPFSVINQGLFDRYSEGYVVCTIIRDSTDPQPGRMRLGLGVYPDKPACYSQFDDSSFKTFSAKEAYDYTDANWNAGIARAFSGFMVKSTALNYIKYAPGSKLRFPNGSVQTILDLSVNPLYINVRLDGPVLSDALLSPAAPSPLVKIDAPFHAYGSQIGVPGFLFSGLFKAIGNRDLNLYRALNTTALAAALAIVIAFAFVEFGLSAALFLSIGLMFSPWLMGFSGNMYWMPWTWYVPLALTCLVMSTEHPFARRVGWKACSAYAVAIAIKAACGYEYMSTVMLASMVPVVYAGLRNAASLQRVFIAIVKLGLSGMVGFTAILLIHAKILGGTVANGMSGIHEDMARRTYAAGAGDAMLGNGSPLMDVLRKYFGNLLQPMIAGVDAPFYAVLAVLSVAALVLLFSADRRHQALSACFFLSILAPMSWFVLAKGHSFVHYFLNPVLWDLPTVPVGLVCLGVCVERIWQWAKMTAVRRMVELENRSVS